MNSNKVEQLMKVEPIRPPSKHLRNKSPTSKSVQKDSKHSSIKRSQPGKENRIINRNEADIGEDENVKILLPQSNLYGYAKESPKFCMLYDSFCLIF